MKRLLNFINKPMVALANWLNEHAIVLGDSLKANVLHLWCILLSFIIVTVFAILGWRGDSMYYLLMVLLLGGCVVPPIFEVFRALVKHDKWTPWYWFPIAIGNGLGTVLSMLVCWIFDIVKV